MYATVVRIPTFGPKESKKIISGVTAIRDAMKPDYIPGFIQSLLLRGERRGALLVTFWRSRQDLHEYLQTKAGQKSSAELARLMGSLRVKYEAYNATWQAVSGDPLQADSTHR